MRLRIKRWTRVAVGCALSTATLGAAADLRLVTAVKSRDARTVDVLLKERVDVNTTQADGATALHWAAYWGDSRIVERLVSAGANVNAADDLGVTPLALACGEGNGAIVTKLLAAGANANAVAATGESVLMACAKTGDVGAVRALILHHADVNVKEPQRGQTALMWAAAHQHSAVVQALVEAGADVRARTRITPQIAVTGDRYTRQNGVAPAVMVEMPTGGFTPLLFAAREGDVESAKFLLAAGANVNETMADGTSALMLAAHSGNATSMAGCLLDRGADLHAAGSGYTALHAAVLRSDRGLVTTLLARGADPNARLTRGTSARRWSRDFSFPFAFIGATPLWLAARYGEPAIMRVLAAGGADPTVRVAGEPLVIAAMAPGATRDRRDRRPGPDKLSPAADERLALETVQAALDLGADVNAAGKRGDTTLHVAASKGYTSVIQALVAAGVHLDAKNERGETALSIVMHPRRQESDDDDESVAPSKDSGTADLLRRLGAKE